MEKPRTISFQEPLTQVHTFVTMSNSSEMTSSGSGSGQSGGKLSHLPMSSPAAAQIPPPLSPPSLPGPSSQMPMPYSHPSMPAHPPVPPGFTELMPARFVPGLPLVPVQKPNTVATPLVPVQEPNTDVPVVDRPGPSHSGVSGASPPKRIRLDGHDMQRFNLYCHRIGMCLKYGPFN